MKKKVLVPIISLALFFTIQPMNISGQVQPFPLKQFKNLVTQRIEWTGARDTISYRVPKGQSCVEAATDRAIEITYVIQSMQHRNTFGPYGAVVGTFSGWNPGIGSMHTYTVVEIYDRTGKVVHTLDVDNYMGPIYISKHSPINRNSNYYKKVQDISPNPGTKPLISPNPGEETPTSYSEPGVKCSISGKWTYAGSGQCHITTDRNQVIMKCSWTPNTTDSWPHYLFEGEISNNVISGEWQFTKEKVRHSFSATVDPSGNKIVVGPIDDPAGHGWNGMTLTRN